MKIKHLLSAGLLLSALSINAQVSENFDKADLSTGTLSCWQSEYTSRIITTSRTAAPTAQSLDSDTRLSLNTTSPITGSGSLRAEETININVWQGAESKETLITPALGADGDVVSINVNFNTLTIPPSQELYVFVECGQFIERHPILSSNVGSTLAISSTISQSSGGGVVKIGIEYVHHNYLGYPTTLNYSLDIDDFSTDAALDPANTCMTSLPVTLASFYAKKTENRVRLAWSTSQESNSDRFEIYRSADTKKWTMLGTEVSLGGDEGFPNYQFIDLAPLSGINYYRLKMVDKDGTFAYSSIRSVEVESIGVKTVAYPNPVTDRLFIQDKEGNALLGGQLSEISLVNLWGAEVYKSTPATLASNSGVDVTGIDGGLYFLKVKLKDGSQSTHKVLVTK
jgi:hypothetical protein